MFQGFSEIATLKKQLRNKTTGDGVARAFLRALVQLIGGYRDALKFHQGQEITFNDAAFVESRPAAMQPFLRKMLDLQIFQQFKEERLNMLNSGQGFTDEFEREACNYMDKSSGTVKQQYKEWLRTVGKEGRAFVKTWVRERGKDVRFVYKGLRSKLKEDKHGEAKSHSAPSSPTQLRKKDISIPLQSNKYSPLESPDLSPPLNINMDLMSDLQHVIFKDCSPTSVQKTMLQAIPSLPPPAVPAKPRLPEPDLIRLDSIDDVLPTSSQCAGVENPLYPYFVPKNLQPQPEKQEEASGSNSSSNSFKQNMDFFSNLSNSSSSQLKSPPSRPSSNYHKAFSFHGKSQDTSNSFDFLTSSSTHPTHTNGFTTSSISSTFPSEPLPSSQPKVLSTFMNHSQPPPLSPRKHSNSESKQNLPLNNLPVNAPRLPLVPTIGPPSYLSYPKPPVLNNGFSHPVQVTSNSSSSEFNSEAKDFFDSILNNNSTTYPSVAQRNGVFASKPSTSTYASRAAFLNEQLGPAVPSIAPKKSVSEWTKFD
ncbi:hypothetical protein M8J76_015491 [Diaphorina citri]|nr:hypothetical protein M8J75_009379 [Diaphorina citri]KAI5730595.1 hypothetical protein M8J76_015491 [Diaphorina citri]